MKNAVRAVRAEGAREKTGKSCEDSRKLQPLLEGELRKGVSHKARTCEAEASGQVR